MSPEIISAIVVLGIGSISGLIGLFVALIRGEMKEFIITKMEEAEKTGKSGIEKLTFVVNAFKEKYKIVQIFLNCKKFVESIIDISKQINHK